VGEGGEAHFAGDFFAELDQGVGGEGDDFSGIEVEEMVVAFASPAAAGAGAFGGVDEIVVGLLADAEVDLFEETGVEEMLEGAVDGGLGSADGGFAEFQEKFFGFEGPAEFLDDLENGEALGGVLELSLAKEVAEEVLGSWHAGRISGKHKTRNIKQKTQKGRCAVVKSSSRQVVESSSRVAVVCWGWGG
jgi:hypothetical protein